MHRALETLAVSVAALLAGALGLRLLRGVGGSGDALLLLAALPPGWLAADLLSGLVHWWADRIATERLPWLGPRLVRPFREHHDDPDAILRHGFFETNGNTCIVLLPLLAAAWWVAPRGVFAGGALFWFLVATALTNQIHKWAHAQRPPRGLRALQRAGVLLDPAHHAGHHAAPFGTRYCITGGWSNPALDRLHAFSRLERWLGRPGQSA